MQREVIDMLISNNFDCTDCGTRFFFGSNADPNSKVNPTNPTQEDKDELAALNKVQLALDLESQKVTKLS